MTESEERIDKAQTAIVDQVNLLTETLEELLQHRADLIGLIDSLNDALPPEQRLDVKRQFDPLVDPFLHA